MRNDFLISQIFQGDIEFKESENASLSVHISAQEKELERVKVEYNFVDGASIVDIQVVSCTIFCTQITSDCANWLAWYQFKVAQNSFQHFPRRRF